MGARGIGCRVVAIVLGALGGVVAVPSAAVAAPFPCTPSDPGKVWVSQEANTRLKQANDGGTIAFSGIGHPAGAQYNALGFRETDNYLYAIRTSNGNLWRIDDAGGPPTAAWDIGLPGTDDPEPAKTNFNAGAISPDGQYLYAFQSSDTRLYRINLATHGVATFPMNRTPGTNDVTFIGGQMWGQDGGSNRLVRISTTGVVTRFAAQFPSHWEVPLAGVQAGSAWTYGNGNLGLADNGSGHVYQVAIASPNSASPSFTPVSETDLTGLSPTGVADGASCPGGPVDLGIEKTGTETVAPGGQITWTLEVTNHGPAPSSGSTVSDTVPASVTNVASPSPGCSVAGNVVTCRPGPLASGAKASFTITGTAPGSGLTIVNPASVTGNETDPAQANNSDSAPTEVVAPPADADLGIDKSGPATVAANGQITWTLLVTNHGPDESSGFSVTDTLPASVTNVASPSPGCSVAGNSVTCAHGKLASGDQASFTITGDAPSSGTVENPATVSGQDNDPVAANNSDSASTDVIAGPSDADLEIDKSGPPTVAPNGQITWNLLVTNNGPAASTGFSVTDTVPASVTNMTSTSPGCSVAGNSVTCGHGALASGAQVSFTITGEAPGSGTVVNTATVSGAESDPVLANNTDSASTTVVDDPGASADLEIRKSASTATASPGDLVTYTFTVKNNGPDHAHDVTVRDPLSPYLQYVSGDAGCSHANSEVVCQLGTLASGQSAAKSIVLRLDPAYSSSAPPTAHDIDVQKVEAFLSMPARATRNATLSCPSGFAMTDANPRVSGVDQGNDPADVHVLGSRTGQSNGAADVGSYRFDIENHTAGQAQVHLFGVCVALSAHGNGGHSLGPASLRTAQIDEADLAGPARVTRTVTCPNPNDVALAPGYVFRMGAGDVHGPAVESEQSASGRSWTFAFEVAPQSATQNDVHVDLSIRCLPRTTASAGGHLHALTFHHVYARVEVGPRATAEHRVSCPVGFKGIAATYDLASGMKLLGTTPEPISRDFRLLNPTNDSLSATIDLVCLRTRIGDELNGGDIQNTAQVYGDGPDFNAGNDFSSWVLHDPPAQSGTGPGSGSAGAGAGDGGGSGAVSTGSGSDPAGSPGNGDGAKLKLRLGETVTHAGRTAMVPVYGGDDPSEGRVELDAGRNHLGSESFSLDAGEDAYVDVKLSKKGRRLLRNRRFVRVALDAGGDRTERVLTVAG